MSLSTKAEEIQGLLRDYYSKTSGLWLPPHPTFRQFRLFLGPEGGGEGHEAARERVIKVRDRVTNIDTLRRWLVRFAPLHAYYTTSKWLDSQNLGPKELHRGSPGYQFAYNVFLSQELYFDIDVPENLEEAKMWTLKLRDALEREYGFQEIVTVYSGNKGFHLHVYDFELGNWVKEISPHPTVRELQTQEVKASIVNHLAERGFVFDADVTIDTRRIIRLPGTIHGKTLNICQVVPDLHAFKPQRLARE